ncbi:MAG TPA: GTP-binding protein [Burkholderiaceae bacterium]|nr:GTP-binding protein [Burkholderiaceae bacterium]
MKRDSLPDHAMQDRGVLRFLTCGSVDDGKSTLIGRLLFDTKALLTDTLDTLQRSSEKRGLSAPDLALLTDGLTAEREQGITIDVAYRYFSTAKRKFIIADAPGHEQYTRNMVTAASTADVAILLIDARKGILPQTRRHASLAALLGINQLILAVNKMDLVDYDPNRFQAIETEFRAWLAQHPELAIGAVHAVPLSALAGDMVVERGARLNWYTGPTLVELLESADDAQTAQLDPNEPLRFPVQWVCRPSANEPRGYAGRIEAGRLSVGDEIVVLPSGARSRITRINLGPETLDSAHAGQSVMVSLADEIDISRGDMWVQAADPVQPRAQFSATLCWFDTTALAPARSYLLRQSTRTVKTRVSSIDGKLDLQRLAWEPLAAGANVGLNDIVRVSLKTQQPLVADPYRRERTTGCFILIDEANNNTVAAGVIEG